MSSGLESLYPEGYWMCQVCFEWIKIDDLYVDKNGDRWDNCITCAPKVWTPDSEDQK